MTAKDRIRVALSSSKTFLDYIEEKEEERHLSDYERGYYNGILEVIEAVEAVLEENL